MVRFLRKFRALLSVYYAETMEYRAEMVLWVAGTVLPFILMGVWMMAAAEGDMGITPAQFGTYFFATFVVRNLTLVWVVWEFEEDVIHGRLSHYLLHPMDPGWRYVAYHLAERAVRIPIIIVIGAVFFAIYPAAMWTPGVGELLTAAGVIALTFTMRFCVQYAFAMMAFWTERAHSVEALWALPYMFLSGMVAPLSLYPAGMQDVLMWTPFPYLIWFPAQVLTGQPVDLLFGLGVMTFWTTIFFATYRMLWWAGLRQYSAMGA
ncbi:MAG: ABC-2 family transporter protein [Phycisphaeraceae bacterium]